jgi:hypothetical protein
LSIAIKPFGERSVFEDRFSKKFMTVSPMLMLLMVTIKSAFLSFADADCL